MQNWLHIKLSHDILEYIPETFGEIILWSLKLLLAPEFNNSWDILLFLVYTHLRYWPQSVLEITIKVSTVTMCRIIAALPSKVQNSFKGVYVCDMDLGEMPQLSMVVVKLYFFSKGMGALSFSQCIHILW